MLTTCPECDGQVSDKASACPHCGAPVPGPGAKARAKAVSESQAEKRQEIEAQRKQNEGWTKIGCGLVSAFALVLLLLNNGHCKGNAPPPKPKPAHDHVSAYTMCQQFVEDRLRAPSTADWPWVSTSDVTEHLGGGKYRVRTYVDSENAFGANVRTTIDCTVQHEEGDRWTLERLETEP